MKGNSNREAVAHTLQDRTSPACDNAPVVIQLVRAPAGLSRSEAAAYVGISPSFFDDMVANGQMPLPLPLGRRRNIWNVRALEISLDKLAGLERRQDQSTDTTEPSSGNDEWLARLRDDRT